MVIAAVTNSLGNINNRVVVSENSINNDKINMMRIMTINDEIES